MPTTAPLISFQRQYFKTHFITSILFLFFSASSRNSFAFHFPKTCQRQRISFLFLFHLSSASFGISIPISSVLPALQTPPCATS